VRGVKTAGIASLIANNRPWSEIEAEMAKCDLVCANCHRIRTAERRAATSAAAASDVELLSAQNAAQLRNPEGPVKVLDV
jgi:hypothetical protein